MKYRIFISSVQDEFAAERRGLKEWLTSDPFVSRFVESVFMFEDVPSHGKSPVDTYLEEVRASHIYIGLVGSFYYGGKNSRRGVSATESEYLAAGEAGVERWMYVKTCDARDKKEAAFLRRVNKEVKRTAFNEFEDLKTAVYLSMVEYLDAKGMIEVGDFDKSVCPEMKKSDIDVERVKWYLREMRARRRKAALPLSTSPMDLMTHLGLLKNGRFTWGAALLFSKNPQRWSYRATLKCTWCEGVEFTRPFLDTDKFEGNLFSLLEQGVDFVMSRISQSRGIRDRGSQVPFRNELPREAVEEAIVNALVHRDWRQTASVDIRLFADRLEVWTPGHLPDDVTIEKLYETHSSYPVNELVLRAFDHAGIIESLGTGIRRMVDACRKNGNPDPEFEQSGPSFIVRLWKDVWTPQRLISVGATERQVSAVMMLKEKRRITTAEYAAQANIGIKTAKRDLIHLEKLGVIVSGGDRKGTFYRFRSLSDIYQTSTDGTVNSSLPKDDGSESHKPLKNKGKGVVATRSKDAKPISFRHGANVSDGTVNGTVSGTVNDGALVGVGALLKLIESNPGCRANALSEMSGKGLRTVKRYLAALTLLKQVEFRGAPKNGGYYIREAKSRVNGKEVSNG